MVQKAAEAAHPDGISHFKYQGHKLARGTPQPPTACYIQLLSLSSHLLSLGEGLVSFDCSTAEERSSECGRGSSLSNPVPDHILG